MQQDIAACCEKRSLRFLHCWLRLLSSAFTRQLRRHYNRAFPPLVVDFVALTLRFVVAFDTCLCDGADDNAFDLQRLGRGMRRLHTIPCCVRHS